MSESTVSAIAKKSVPRIIIKVVLWILSLFVVGGIIDYVVNHELKAEAKRLEAVNEAQRDSMDSLLDTLGFQATVVGVLTFELDSLRERTGPIRWRTVYTDTGSTVIDSIPFVVVDSQEVDIPVAIAKELKTCRVLRPECEKLRVRVDALIAYIPTVIDSMQAEIDIKDEIISGPKWNLGLFKIPKPQDSCGIFGGYRITGGTGGTSVQTESFDDITISSATESGNSRWAILVGCGIGFRTGIL